MFLSTVSILAQLLLVIVVSFTFITWVVSANRYHNLTELTNNDLPTNKDRSDFFSLQVAHYLNKTSHASPHFIVMVLQLQIDASEKHSAQNKAFQAIQPVLRKKEDKACLLHDDCIGILFNADEGETHAIARRMTHDLTRIIKTIPEISAFRSGIASFPLHGQLSEQIIDTATNALQQVSFESEHPIRIAPSPKEKPEKEQRKTHPQKLGKSIRQGKMSAIDPLTGVLTQDAIGPYFRKHLLDIRWQREPAAVLCIGIDHIENLIQLYGKESTDTVIAGVSRIIQDSTREIDLIGRYHRSEFLVLAVCTQEQSKKIGLRICNAVQKETFLTKEKHIKTSTSFGIANHPEHGHTLRSLCKKAHHTLKIIQRQEGNPIPFSPTLGKKSFHKNRYRPF